MISSAAAPELESELTSIARQGVVMPLDLDILIRAESARQRDADIAELQRWFTSELEAFRVELLQAQRELRQARSDLFRLLAINAAREVEREPKQLLQ